MAYHRVLALTSVVASLLFGKIPAAQSQKQVDPASGPRLTGEGRNLKVQLHLFNMARLPSTLLRDAEVEASSVYRAAGVTLVWDDGLAGWNPASSSETAVDLQVIVVGGTAERRLIDDGHLGVTVLGFAPTKRDCFCGRNAYVFSERIMAVGYRRGHPTSLLGRVIAHEVGHLLLSSNSHSRTEIMRATLDTELSFQPRFTQEQARALMRGFVRLQPRGAIQNAEAGGHRP